MRSDDDMAVLVRRFHEAGDRLTSRSRYTDEEMGAADQAQRQRVEALQTLVDQASVDGAAGLLGMTVKQVEDELRVDRSIE